MEGKERKKEGKNGHSFASIDTLGCDYYIDVTIIRQWPHECKSTKKTHGTNLWQPPLSLRLLLLLLLLLWPLYIINRLSTLCIICA